MLQGSGAGTTMNSLAAPDVRAPSVRGRWHFRRFSRLFSPIDSLFRNLRLGRVGGGGYTLAAMNDAIQPGPETPSQAGLPELSVVVPTFNERDNVTVLYRRLEATLSGIAWE